MYMHIFVRGIRGDRVPLGVDGSDTIADLKEWIENLFGYPQDRQTLVFEGKVLHDDCRSVADYRFQEDSTVFIQLAPDPQFSKTSMSMQQKTSLKRKLPPLMPGAYKALAESLGLKPKEVKSAVEGVFALTAEQVKRTRSFKLAGMLHFEIKNKSAATPRKGVKGAIGKAKHASRTATCLQVTPLKKFKAMVM